MDRLISESTPQGGVSYTYDAAGRRTSMTVVGQPTVSYTYDNANRLIQITQGTSVVSFTYDAAGRRTSLTLPNGILVEYSYDQASRVTKITYKKGVTVLGDLTYDYDKAGNRVKVGGSFARTGTPQAVATSNYNAGNQQLALGDKTMTFDNNGNLTSITDPSGTTIYNWNARNQLVGISGPGVTGSFVYDGLGRREKKTVNGSLAEFLFDGVNPVQETSGATVLANILPGLGIDEYLARSDSSGTSYFLQGTLGSALALTDSSGTVQTEYTYEPFGKTTSSGVSTTNPFQYTGRENDGTGLFYYRARYYHPGLQRFISEDPFGLAGGDFNLYAYVHNNPTNLVDPEGNLAFFWHFGITFVGGLRSGMGVIDSLRYAGAAALPDFRSSAWSPTQEAQVGHAMAGEPSEGTRRLDPQQALRATDAFIQGRLSSSSILEQGQGFHATQDVPQHQGERWPPSDNAISNIFKGIWHVVKDIFPSPSVIAEAYNRTLQAFETTETGGQTGGRK